VVDVGAGHGEVLRWGGASKGVLRQRLSYSSAAAGTSHPRSGPGRAEGLVCALATTSGRQLAMTVEDSLLRLVVPRLPSGFDRSYPLHLAGCTIGLVTWAQVRMPGRRPWKVDCTGVLTAGGGIAVVMAHLFGPCGWRGVDVEVSWCWWWRPPRSCVGSSVRRVSVV
jgi:hypothetical protein